MKRSYLLLLAGRITLTLPEGALRCLYIPSRHIGFTPLIWRTFTYYWYLLVSAPIFVYQAGVAADDLRSRSHRVRSPAKPHFSREKSQDRDHGIVHHAGNDPR